jgi:hypothetical protein
MPGVRSVRVLRQGQDEMRIALSQRLDGHSINAELDCSFGNEAVHLRQHLGDFRKWDAVWHLLTPPEGGGTTLQLEMDLEIGGVMGLLATGQRIDTMVEQVFRDTLVGIETRARAMTDDQPATEAPGELLLQIYQTPEGLEVWIDGQMLKLPPTP